jgi:hypothetical protein
MQSSRRYREKSMMTQTSSIEGAVDHCAQETINAGLQLFDTLPAGAGESARIADTEQATHQLQAADSGVVASDPLAVNQGCAEANGIDGWKPFKRDGSALGFGSGKELVRAGERRATGNIF